MLRPPCMVSVKPTGNPLCEGVLGGIVVALREVVVDLVHGDAHVLENLPEILTLMAEHNSAVVWVVLQRLQLVHAITAVQPLTAPSSQHKVSIRL